MVDRTKNPTTSSRAKKAAPEATENLATVLSQKVVGQPAATSLIVPYIQMFQAGLAPEGRPVGVFLLLGPTGTGKTKTVEALAEVIHGSEKNLLKVDCGEFQMEHEVAKLIGAPPCRALQEADRSCWAPPSRFRRTALATGWTPRW